jgi:hypothetical protein
MKKLLTCCFVLVSSLAAWAQTADDAIKATVNNYFEGITTGDASKLNKAFHETAILRTFNTATGQIQDIPVKTFISKTPAGGVKASTKLISYAYAGVSGLATVELQFEEFKYIDLLSLLQVNGDWKIVTRVFSRVDLDTQLKSSESNVQKPTKKAPAKKKDNDW